MGRLSAMWDALVGAALIVPHEGLRALPRAVVAQGRSGGGMARAADGGGGGGAAATAPRGSAARAAKGEEEDDEAGAEAEEYEEEEEGGGDGAGGGEKLWRFGWEAATRRMRNRSLSLFIRPLLEEMDSTGRRQDKRVTELVVSALLRLGERATSREACEESTAAVEGGAPRCVNSAEETVGAPLIYAAPAADQPPAFTTAEVLAELRARTPLRPRVPVGGGEARPPQQLPPNGGRQMCCQCCGS